MFLARRFEVFVLTRGRRPRVHPKGAKSVGTEDKIRNKVDDLGGKAKEAAGRVTGDEDTKNEGKFDQAKSSLKDAGEKVKDAFRK